MAPRRRHIGASRRQRRDEEGEDEGPPAAEVEDDSLSEGSAESHQDDEDADVEASETEDEVTAGPDKLNGKKLNGREQRYISPSPDKPGLKATASDTEAMLNGLTISNDTEEDSLGQINDNQEPPTSRTPSAPPTESKREPLATKKKRENDKYVKEREQNPAFVPTKGSFFLHDNRAAETGSNGRSSNSNKSKSRPFGLIVDGNARRNSSKADASGGLWRHDLHDTVAGDDPPVSKQASSLGAPPPSTAVPTAPRSSPPNRSFSSTTLVGNVPVIVSLPGMDQPKSFPAVPKNQHTRLPQHRPPLRRDKPVRISLPDHLPRYIFPSTERSFIFIPRALRPNQQGYRGRGRGSGFYPQRRQSYYPGSYTPSVVSRRSSFGVAPSQDGYPSPAGSVYSRPVQPMPPMFPLEPNKPVVRLPPHPRPPMGMPPPGMPMMPAGPGPVPPSLPLPFPAYREGRPAQTMHQPRPKKPVSVADIESPATYALNQSRPPPEQPFHHQVPVATNGPGPGPDGTAHDPTGQPSATPLSQIPERAIHAVPFNPYGYQQPGNLCHTWSPPSSGEQSAQGTVAHELNGTVYFHPNPSANYGAPHGQGPGGVVGMGGMITPPGATYYYPQPPGGGAVFYGQP
ncbi:hypothetical protein N7468_009030 [Penicillium chermesinum]|uniref:Btz domain-containing protein n=1 Tax=Penicillium chermesinum TaxID=63820 RepID=A0A9W9NH32_9EURO|nr:uncharacterized protein N7468_009030 [Penicillium chermesinum]KAJ5219826.1 hypothetical protein N7468_009030 [Penicillium chermesinum]